jgi:hypothetical protein
MPVISALRRLRKEIHKFKANLSYIERPCQKGKDRKGKERVKVHPGRKRPSS